VEADSFSTDVAEVSVGYAAEAECTVGRTDKTVASERTFLSSVKRT
jgi:hypothetical protein